MAQKENSSTEAIRNVPPRSKIRKYYRPIEARDTNLMSYITNRNWMPYRNFNVSQLARNHPPFLRRLNLMKKLPIHDGCVNTICWNATGEYILSGSDDRNLCITKPTYLYDSSESYTVLHKVHTHHLGNIFCANFIPNSCDTKTVSCSNQGPVIVHDIYAHEPSEGILTFNCHSSTIYQVVPLPDHSNIFLSCSEDKTIRLFDMRVHRSCPRAGTCPHPALIRNSHAVTTMKLHPLNSNLILVGRADGTGLVYDRRRLPDVTKFSREAAHAERIAGANLLSSTFKYRHPMEGAVGQFQVPEMDTRYRFTSLDYNKDGSQVLASYSGEYIYLFDHDTSSNIELVQTLPKKPSKSSSTGDSASNGATQDEESSPQPTRISHIRVRGDWSDTGVNSMPQSRLANATSSSSSSGSSTSSRPQVVASVAFLEHVARSLRSRSPSFMSSTRSSTSNDSEPRQSRRSHDDDTPLSGRTESDHRASNPSQDSSRQNSIHENDDQDDDDENEDNNLELLEEDEADELYTIVDDGHDDEDGDAEMDFEDRDGSNNNSGESNDEREVTKRTKNRRSISSETRDKFRKTLDHLRDKYKKIPSYKPRVKYQGHRNSRTSFKEAIFWGDDYIMSGSDCGRIMVWEKESAKLLMAFQADERVVNCLSPNPHHYVLATSGIDYDIKLWSTQSLHEGPLLVGEKEMNRIVENNEIMLEESKHTFSVPPYIFFRVLANLARS